MAEIRKTGETPRPRRRPAKTPEARERQLFNMATELAEKQIEKGTATSQVIVHYLKLGTAREDLEKEKLKQENELLKARVKSLAAMEDIKVLYGDALKAMKRYSGQSDEEDYED